MNKKLQTLFVSIILFTCAGIAQTYYTVDNRPGFPANYRSLQGAVDSVPSGSIILLQPSGQSYGYANVTKPVVIYGAGYFLGQNSPPNTQAQINESIVTALTFSKGSDGSQVSGLHFATYGIQSPSNVRVLTDSTSNISISRCNIEFYSCCCQGCNSIMFRFQNSANITIEKCYLGVQAYLFSPSNTTGILFQKNIIICPSYSNFQPVGFWYGSYSYTFDHNSLNVPIAYSIDFSGGNYTNNVIISNTTGTTIVTSAMNFADHNVSNKNIFPSGGTNISNADGANTYVGFTNPTISSSDGIWQLKQGSVATGYANDGTDAGAYGTTSPYVLSGIPAIPNIYFAQPQQTGTSQGGLKIQLKIKANN